MKILVMGGTEFVSSSLTKYLISKGYIVDIFTRGIKLTKYDGIRNHLKGDRKSIEDLQANISSESYDYIFDTSAYTKEDVQKLIAILNKENLKRYVFCSSGSVYIPSDEIVTEEFTRGENENWGSYGLDKKKAEEHGLYIPKIDLFEGLELAYNWYCTDKPEVTDAKMNKIDLVLDI
jgi:nucleoside-diphosphate-sugar epimerase